MKKIYQIPLLILLSVLFSSCINNSTEEKIISYNVTSKKSQLSNKSGQAVSLDEMISISVQGGESIIFKNINFTLDNKIDEALNFYSENGKLMLLTPTELSTMNMPPDGNGITKHKAGENIEISGTTLIKVNSISFVISNIRLK
mgnify:CR=1 FL=1